MPRGFRDGSVFAAAIKCSRALALTAGKTRNTATLEASEITRTPMLWDYLKTLIMLRLTLQPCMCSGCNRGRRALLTRR